MKPTNTTVEVEQDPLLGLFTAMGGIEHQEAIGQRELVNSESLPTDCDHKEALEAAGVHFGVPYADDPLFCPVTLPAGWLKRATDHSMHSELIDDKGRVRAKIFYRAAFYDRKADMYAIRRFNIDTYQRGSDEHHSRCVVKDGDTIIHDLGERPSSDYKQSEKFQAAAEAWLTEHYPDWRSPAAYWD